ncbi:MAG: ComEC/Rec2 family competence protein [bacterium]
MSPSFHKTSKLALILLVLGALWWGADQVNHAKDGGLRVRVFDVGQGDAILVETPNDHQILFDGGPDKTILEKLGAALPSSDRSLDAIVLTHPHADHVNGLPAVLERYQVGTVYLAGVVHTTNAYLELLKILNDKKIPVVILEKPEKIDFGDGVVMQFVAPLKSWSGQTLVDLHQAMVVAKIIYGEDSVLLTGDMGQGLEAELIATQEDSRAEVLKVGHHGSKTSSSAAFLDAVEPRIALISVGAGNSYGHPHADTLDRLRAVGAEIWRTDLNKDLLVMCDGKICSVQGEELRFFGNLANLFDTFFSQ